MPRICTVCRNDKLNEINTALVGNEAYRSVAKRFSLSPPAVFRHQSQHLPAHLAKAKQASEIAAASTLVDELLRLTKTTRQVLARAIEEKDGELALKAIARLERQLELKGRLLGELEDGRKGETHIVVSYVDKMLVAPAAPTSVHVPAGCRPESTLALEAAKVGV